MEGLIREGGWTMQTIIPDQRLRKSMLERELLDKWTLKSEECSWELLYLHLCFLTAQCECSIVEDGI